MASHYILAPTCAQPFSVMPAQPPALIPPSIHANKALRDAEEYKWLQNDAVAPSYAQELLRERLNRAPSWVDAFTSPQGRGKNSWTSRMPGTQPPTGEEVWALIDDAMVKLRGNGKHPYSASLGQREHITELPDHIKALPEEEQGPALVKAMHDLIDWDPAADNTPKGFA